MLECKNITKTFGIKTAVSDVSLNLKPGKIYGLLGENGSGKTTWMKMMAGFSKPDKGEITYNGHPLSYKDKAEIAYMSTEPFFYNYMKVQDVADYYADFFPEFDKDLYWDMLQKAKITGNLKITSLSTGMCARVKTAATMARKAKVYLLDEPFNGIDYKAREEIISAILQEADENKIMVISTHLIEEVESFIEDAIFFKESRMIRTANLERERMNGGKSLTDLYMELM